MRRPKFENYHYLRSDEMTFRLGWNEVALLKKQKLCIFDKTFCAHLARTFDPSKHKAAYGMH